jgi:crotonobetainyl-CoA:carnitine CoA-transferase CaiB-like acyl-CoA transferase
VDVKSPAGLARVRALAADADLFITSQRPSALARLAVDHASLVGACPQLRLLRIVGSIREPEAPGHDLTYQASAGLLQERLPVTLVADLMAAERAVGAALLLLRRPAGSVMDVGLSDSLAPLQAPLRHGLTAPGGLLGGGLPEYGIYDAKDGRVAVAALEPHFRQRLVERLRLATTDGLAEAFRARTVKEWQDWAHDNDVPLVGVD